MSADNELIDHLRYCYRQVREYEEESAETLREAFPVGSDVTWRIGRAQPTGIVLSHSPYHDRLYVRNHKTGVERWIEGHDVLRALDTHA